VVVRDAGTDAAALTRRRRTRRTDVSIDVNTPADTTMMRIVHQALRRDLRRATAALRAVPAPDARRRVALARHLTWMMSFIETHHRTEDLGLYPLVRTRAPHAAALLDAMTDGHEAVATAMAAVEAASTGYAEGEDPRRLVGALDDLVDVLLPHLQLEEDEMMPVVSRVVTAAEWNDIEQRYQLAGKSMAQLGREGHWLIDDASAADRKTVLQLVPLAQRLLLLYGFGPVYRRHARACWRPRSRRLQHEGSTSVVVAADVDAVWAVVRDPTRVGEWSHECVDGVWLGDATAAVPGARFRGRNRQGLARWGRVCEVVRAAPYELVWRTVPTRLYPDSSEWTLRLEPDAGRTRIEQTFHVVKTTKLEPIYATIVPAHRDRTAELAGDLERIGALASPAPIEGWVRRCAAT
jgi:hemerythrin-like domain-containing protein